MLKLSAAEKDTLFHVPRFLIKKIEIDNACIFCQVRVIVIFIIYIIVCNVLAPLLKLLLSYCQVL